MLIDYFLAEVRHRSAACQRGATSGPVATSIVPLASLSQEKRKPSSAPEFCTLLLGDTWDASPGLPSMHGWMKLQMLALFP